MKKCERKIKFYDKANEITITFEKPITFIYGSNGVGKTTMSKELNKSSDSNFEFFVFNEYYIANNIYLFEKGEAKSTTNLNKEKAKFFITKELYLLGKLVKKINDLKYNGDDLERTFNLWKVNHKYQVFLNKTSFDEINKFWKKETEKIIKLFKKDVIKTEILNYKNYSTNEEYYNLLTTGLQKFYSFDNLNTICNEFDYDSFNEFYEKIINEDEIANFNKEIIDSFNFEFEKFYKKISEHILKYNEYWKNQDEYNKILSSISNLLETYDQVNLKNIKPDELQSISNWISKGDEIHKKHALINTCLYCSQQRNCEPIIKTGIEKIITFKLQEIIKSIKKEFNLFTKKLNELFEKVFYLEKFENIQKFIKLKENEINNILANYINFKEKTLSFVDSNQQIKINTPYFNQVKKIECEKENLEKIIFNLFIKENFNEKIKQIISFDLIKLAKEKAIKILKEIEKSNLEDIQKSINEVLVELDKLQVKPLGITAVAEKGNLLSPEYIPQITLKDKNKKEVIENISNGQRNMVAFIYYIVQLKELKKKCDKEGKELFSVLDDIVDGSDFYSYFIMKYIITNYIGADGTDINVILLTHNYAFANIYIQKTEAKEGKENFIDLYLFNDKFKLEKINHEIFNMPDILLISKIKEQIKNKTGANKIAILISWLTIALKILESRFIEIYQINMKQYLPFSDEPFVELGKYIVPENEHYKLFQLFKSARTSFTKYIKNSSPENGQKMLNHNKQLFEKLNEDKIIELDFNNIFNEKFDFSIKEILEFEYSNEEDFILKNAWNATRIMLFSKFVQKRKKENEIEYLVSNYLRHSPNSISSPVIALNYKDIIKKIKRSS